MTRKTGLDITQQEADLLTNITFNQYYNQIATSYNAEVGGGQRFQALPQWAQTVIMDAGYALGPNLARNAHQEVKDFWNHAIHGAWQAAYSDLLRSNLDRRRRLLEASLIFIPRPRPSSP